MSLSNEELIQLVEKSIVTPETGGQVSAQQARDFVNLMVDQTAVMQEMRVERDIIKELTIDGLEFGDPVVQKAPSEGTEPASNEQSEPDMPRLTITPAATMISVNLSFNWLRQNIRGEGGGEEAINAALAKAAGRDFVRLIFNGDTSLDSSTKLNRLLRVRDGILKKLRADSDVNDYVVAASPVYTGEDSEFGKGLDAVPDQYRDDREMLRHFTSISTVDAYENEVSNRQTAAADNVLFGPNAVTMHRRVKIVPVFGFPNNTNLTTHMSNVVLGFGRDMKMYREIKPRKQQVEITIITDIDFGYVFGQVAALGEQA
jgi:hypothetical protein